MAGPAELLDTLAACFCSLLDDSLGGAPAICCVVSAAPVIPSCCDGFAWVRMTGSFPTDNFPSQGYTPATCLPPTWGLSLEMGVSRCAPASCDDLGNPCCEQEATAVAVLLSDFEKMKLALLCCLPGAIPGLNLRDIELGAWVPGDPSGGCVQSTMTATIRYTDTCSCA